MHSPQPADDFSDGEVLQTIDFAHVARDDVERRQVFEIGPIDDHGRLDPAIAVGVGKRHCGQGASQSTRGGKREGELEGPRKIGFGDELRQGLRNHLRSGLVGVRRTAALRNDFADLRQSDALIARAGDATRLSTENGVLEDDARFAVQRTAAILHVDAENAEVDAGIDVGEQHVGGKAKARLPRRVGEVDKEVLRQRISVQALPTDQAISPILEAVTVGVDAGRIRSGDAQPVTGCAKQGAIDRLHGKGSGPLRFVLQDQGLSLCIQGDRNGGTGETVPQDPRRGVLDGADDIADGVRSVEIDFESGTVVQGDRDVVGLRPWSDDALAAIQGGQRRAIRQHEVPAELGDLDTQSQSSGQSALELDRDVAVADPYGSRVRQRRQALVEIEVEGENALAEVDRWQDDSVELVQEVAERRPGKRIGGAERRRAVRVVTAEGRQPQ